MESNRPFDLANESAVFIVTVSGQVVFVHGPKHSDAVGRACRLARTAEGIAVDPGPGASLADSGVAEFSVGLPAWEKIQAYLRSRG